MLMTLDPLTMHLRQEQLQDQSQSQTQAQAQAQIDSTREPEIRLGMDWSRVRPAASQGWTLPDGLFRLGMFLTREREAVLLRLMDTVTVRTVNHENICCLNTALLILVLVHRR